MKLDKILKRNKRAESLGKFIISYRESLGKIYLSKSNGQDLVDRAIRVVEMDIRLLLKELGVKL